MQGAGLSWLLQTRRLPFGDVLLLMIALSDNLCTNLVIRRIGIARLNAIFRGPLGLLDTRIERKLFDYDTASAGPGQLCLCSGVHPALSAARRVDHG